MYVAKEKNNTYLKSPAAVSHDTLTISFDGQFCG